MLETDLDFKRTFLGIRSALDRVTVLLRILPGVADDLESRAAVRERAARNGSGGAHADVIQS